MPKELIFNEYEFEYEVRERLKIFDRPIMDSNVLEITELDLTNFDFSNKDLEVLSLFKNLEFLAMDTCDENLDFLKSLTKLQELDIVSFPHSNRFDFLKIKHLKNLTYLRVSGGDVSDINFINIDALAYLPKLKELHFHEFGTVDFSCFKPMPQLEHFFCGYANEIKNIEDISNLSNLKSIELIAIYVDNIAFLDCFPDDITGELSLIFKNNVNLEKLKRFKKLDVHESDIYGKQVF